MSQLGWRPTEKHGWLTFWNLTFLDCKSKAVAFIRVNLDLWFQVITSQLLHHVLHLSVWDLWYNSYWSIWIRIHLPPSAVNQRSPSLAIMSTMGRMSTQALRTKHHRVLREGEGERAKDKRDIKKEDSFIGSTLQIPSLMARRNGRITFLEGEKLALFFVRRKEKLGKLQEWWHQCRNISFCLFLITLRDTALELWHPILSHTDKEPFERQRKQILLSSSSQIPA